MAVDVALGGRADDGDLGWLALRVLSTFLSVASIGIAAAAIALPRQLPAVAAPIAFALISRGAFDAPLRALAAVTAGVWVLVAALEEGGSAAEAGEGE